jgi:hypothetical protein
MPAKPDFKLPLQAARPAYRTLRGWALGTLIDQGAVLECPEHGHRIDRADPDAFYRAREDTSWPPIMIDLPQSRLRRQT